MANNIVQLKKYRLPAAWGAWCEVDQWVLWRAMEEGENGDETKPPFQPLHPLNYASVKNPKHWSSFANAVANAPTIGKGGIGFVLGGERGGIDLDHCFDDKDELKPWARKIVDLAKGQCIDESPSGKGLHILGYVNGAKPPFTRIDFGDGHVEVYRKSPRYFTVTGKQYGRCEKMGNIDAVIDAILLMKSSVSLKGAVKEEKDKTRSVQLWQRIRDELRLNKYSDDEIFDRLEKDWVDYKGPKRLMEDIVRTRVKYEEERGGVVGQDDESEIEYVSLAKLLDEFVPPDYLIDGILSRRYLYAFTGHSGSGKTSVMLRIAAMVGRDSGKMKLGDHEVERGCVIYLAGENPDDVSLRCSAMLEHMGLDGCDLNIHFFVGTTDLKKNIQILNEKAMPLKPDLIIVDTARAYFMGDDENSNAEMVNYARLLRRFTETGACVIINCHPTKNASDDLRPAGGYAFYNQIDANLTCDRQDNNSIILGFTKLRTPDFMSLQFELKEWPSRFKDKKGRVLKSVIAVPMTEEKIENRNSQQRRDWAAVLEAMVSLPNLSIMGIADHLEWKKAGVTDKLKVQRIMDKLHKRKFVHQATKGSHYTITTQGKKWLRSLRQSVQRAEDDAT